MLAIAMPVMGASVLLLTTIVATAIWGTLRWSQAPTPVMGQSQARLMAPTHDPVMTLRERYARGEISLETFEEMLERVDPRSDESDNVRFPGVHQ